MSRPLMVNGKPVCENCFERFALAPEPFCFACLFREMLGDIKLTRAITPEEEIGRDLGRPGRES